MGKLCDKYGIKISLTIGMITMILGGFCCQIGVQMDVFNWFFAVAGLMGWSDAGI